VALFVSTLGVLMATIDGSITLIALPDIFRGVGIDPLQSGNTFYLLWMILGFLVVTSVLVVTFGRLGDIYGRVRTYNLGFAVFTFFSLALSVTWLTGHAGGLWLIVMRLGSGAWPWGSTRRPRSAARSSGSYSVVCSLPSIGG
jgi:MFS family permease